MLRVDNGYSTLTHTMTHSEKVKTNTQHISKPTMRYVNGVSKLNDSRTVHSCDLRTLLLIRLISAH